MHIRVEDIEIILNNFSSIFQPNIFKLKKQIKPNGSIFKHIQECS
jgi:hypothetical protein